MPARQEPSALPLPARPVSSPAPRVAHVIHSGGFYGAEKVVCDLARAQADDALSPAIIALLDPGQASNALADRAAGLGLAVFRLGVPRGISWRGLRDYARALRACGASLVHSHGYKATCLHLLSRRLGLQRLPLLVTSHGYPKGSGNWKATLYRRLDLLLLPRAEGVVAVSGEMERYLAAHSPACRPRLIPNGIARLSARGTHPLRRRLAGEGGDDTRGGPVIGSAGRLVPMKNHALLIRAYARLRRELPCRLAILGDGPLRGDLEALWRELVPGEPVRLYPFQDDALEWMADMDVFCLPSNDGEGLPIALLEAGLLERAVVCSDSGGMPELLRDGENGRLFPMGSLAGLVAGLRDMLADPAARARRGAALRRDVLRGHDMRATHLGYLEAYARVLSTPLPTP